MTDLQEPLDYDPVTYGMLDFLHAALADEEETARIVEIVLAKSSTPYVEYSVHKREGAITTTRHLDIYQPARVYRHLVVARQLLETHVPMFEGAEYCAICNEPSPCGVLKLEAYRWGWNGH
jgi:hypothetical protein